MRNRVKDILDGWLTSIFGVACMTLTLLMIWKGSFDFVPEGIAGFGVGALLLMAPKTIERKISEFIKAWGNKSDFSSGVDDCSSGTKPDNPDADADK